MINIAIIDDDKTFCDDFKEQISKIGINFEDRCFNSKIYANNEQDLHSSIWRFIEKLFLLANIELLK